MSKPYVPGPSLIFVGTGVATSFQHLGFCERAVSVNNVPRHEGVSVDLAGAMDYDVQFMGEEIYVSFRLVRYNEAVLSLCKQRLGSALAPLAGSGAAGAIGALMGLEGNTFPLAIVSQYASKAVFGDMVPGIHIPRAYLADSNSVELGTQVKLEQVVFRGLANFGVDGSYTLFSYSVAGLDLPTPT